MAYLLAGVAGVAYALLQNAVTKKWGVIVSFAISILLFLLVSIGWRAGTVAISLINSIGFSVWFISPVVGIFVVNRFWPNHSNANIVICVVGFIAWAGFTQVSRGIGYLLGY